MTIHINKDRALRLLKKAIKDRGTEYVYEKVADGGCVYVVNGEPSCLVGQVVAYIKPELIPLIEIWEREEDSDYDEEDDHILTLAGNQGSTDAYDLATALKNSNEIEFTVGARELLRYAQEQQDAGVSWGKALEYAIRMTSGYSE